MLTANELPNGPSPALRIDLVYDRECPHVGEARAVIGLVLEEVNARVTWREWDREHAATPSELRHYGSPTILVNGHDVAGDDSDAARSSANSCRVYPDGDGSLRGVPSTQSIIDAIRSAR